MAKRLQVIVKDSEYREIQRAARSRHMSIAEWVRQALEAAHRRQHVASISKKLESIRIAAQHEYPVGDIDQILAEIGMQCTQGKHPFLRQVLDKVGGKAQARWLTPEVLDSLLKDE